MTAWALKTGSEFPPLIPGKLRLYSMRFCPYAQRALLILRAKSIDHEVVNVNLVDKPEWSKDVLPEGSVPVLAQDDKLISGSMAIAEYLEEAYPETKPTWHKDPYLKALDRSFFDVALPAIDPVVSVLKGKGSREENWATFLGKIALFEKELLKRQTNFFFGQQPGFVDYVMWPTFILARGITAVCEELKMPAAEIFPRLSNWSQHMREEPCVRALVDDKHTALFVQSCVAGSRDFNAGLH
ncbi:hypothetical protein V5799_011018 [Amblyomma americanum]|uniref:Glutathione s-transferase n=1 Tax=Amblyomma americanum TaxID=6943 RepID=A0AAQ4EI60_AMBAM